jgi:uncharacterized protein
MRLDNPFPVFGYFGPTYFCDRREETRKLREAFLNGRNVTLVAPRRFGKTGLIHHVFNDLAKRGEASCVYLDIFAVKTLPEFVQVFARAVFSSLETRLERAARAAGQFLSACRPNVSIDAVTGSPSLSLSLDRVDSERTLKDVFDYLASRKGRIVIAVDEFQQVAEFPEKGAEALLRGYIQFLPNVRFIFAGSKAHMMSEMFLSANRPFYKSTQNISLATIDAAVYSKFASAFFKKAGRPFSDEAFRFAYGLVDGVTWEVQSIMNRLWSRGVGLPDEASVRAVVEEILCENSDEYAGLVANLTVNEAKVLRGVAKGRRIAAPTSAAFSSAVGLSPSSVKLAVDNLVARQRLSRDADGVFVSDRFLRLWLAK